MSQEKLLTSRQVAELLKASHGSINNRCRRGEFPGARKVQDRFGTWSWEIPNSALEGVEESKMGRRRKKD